MKRLMISGLVGLLVAAWVGLLPATAHAQDECQPIAAEGPGVQRIEGQGIYSFYGIPTVIVDQPVVALVDDGLAALGDRDTFPPVEGQVIGSITSDFFTSPFSYTINLPSEGLGVHVDVDQDGEEDAGVHVYEVVLAQNVLNTVPLEGVAQAAILGSYYRNDDTKQIVEGALVIYAPDDAQGFPCAYGEDGELFTSDDPTVALPQGFTVANIKDGKITFDRSEVARVYIADAPSSATPDFSNQGILESYNTLFDFLRERYAFNEFANLYNLDWDTLYAEFLPRVEKADAAHSLGDYYVILIDLAHEVHDAHTYTGNGAIFSDPEAMNVIRQAVDRVTAGVGAELAQLDDGRVIVVSTKPGSPAEEAGWQFGTEIVSVDGVPSADVLKQPVRLLTFPGTDEASRLAQLPYLLKQPVGTEMAVAYLQPGSTEVQTSTLTTGIDLPSQPEEYAMPMEYKILNGIGYVRWPSFSRTGIATHIFADFVKVMNEKQIPGIVIDLRGNSGGAALMEVAVMSYLFSADNPLDFSSVEDLAYDESAGHFVRTQEKNKVSSPPGSQPYLGDVVVLVDENCASACEFMSYWLQASGRATIVGQFATAGAGGNTNAVILPGGIQFNYTEGASLDRETGQPIFQQVGVQPDVRVPVTEETESLKQKGSDPVQSAGIEHLRRLAFQRLDHESAPFVDGAVISVKPSGWKLNSTGDGYTSPDGETQLTIDLWTKTSNTDPDAVMAQLHPDIKKVNVFDLENGTWATYGLESDGEYGVYGVTIVKGQPYIVSLTSTDRNQLIPAAEFVFVPALRNFEVAQ